jgi:hypothetical protein
MYAIDELDKKIELLLLPDDKLSGCGIEYRDNLIKGIESMYDKVVQFRGEKTHRNMDNVCEENK